MIFSPDGRLYQIEYARTAIEQGATTLGIKAANGVVLAAAKRANSPLLVGESIEKLHRIDDHIGVASTGHAADGRILVDLARRRAQIERVRYADPIDIATLTRTLTDRMQEYTQVGGARPFGVGLLVAGLGPDGPRLYQTDPSGNFWAFQAAALGERWRDPETYLERHYEPRPSIPEAIRLALAVFEDVSEMNPVPDDVTFASIAGTPAEYRSIPGEEFEAGLEIDPANGGDPRAG